MELKPYFMIKVLISEFIILAVKKILTLNGSLSDNKSAWSDDESLITVLSSFSDTRDEKVFT